MCWPFMVNEVKNAGQAALPVHTASLYLQAQWSGQRAGRWRMPERLRPRTGETSQTTRLVDCQTVTIVDRSRIDKHCGLDRVDLQRATSLQMEGEP